MKLEHVLIGVVIFFVIAVPIVLIVIFSGRPDQSSQISYDPIVSSQPTFDEEKFATMGYIYHHEDTERTDGLLLYGRPRYEQTEADIWEYNAVKGNKLRLIMALDSDKKFIKRLKTGDEVVFQGSFGNWTVDMTQADLPVAVKAAAKEAKEIKDEIEKKAASLLPKTNWTTGEITLVTVLSIVLALTLSVPPYLSYTIGSLKYSPMRLLIWLVISFVLAIALVIAVLVSKEPEKGAKKAGDKKRWTPAEIILMIVMWFIFFLVGPFLLGYQMNEQKKKVQPLMGGQKGFIAWIILNILILMAILTATVVMHKRGSQLIEPKNTKNWTEFEMGFTIFASVIWFIAFFVWLLNLGGFRSWLTPGSWKFNTTGGWIFGGSMIAWFVGILVMIPSFGSTPAKEGKLV